MRKLASLSRGGLGSALVMGCVGVMSCSDADWVESEDALGTTPEPLSIKGEEVLWHTQNNNVHVCFVNSSTAYRSTFQTVITETWEASSGLKFTWHGTCASPPAHWIPVYFKEVDEGDWGGFASYGVGGRRNHCSHSDPGDTTEFQVCVRHPPSGHMFLSSMVHEMGHALGMLHEQERQDDPNPGASCDSTPEPAFAQVLSLFDELSIMKYCRDFDANGVADHEEGHDLYALSPSDKVGVAQAYAHFGVQVLTATTDGALLDTFRRYDGSWPFAFQDVEAQAGDIGTIRDIAAEHTTSGLTFVLARNSAGALKLATRSRDLLWDRFDSGWNNITGGAGNPGTVLRVGLGEINNRMHAMVVTSDGKLKLTHQLPFPQSWSAWEDVEAHAGDIGTPLKAGGAGIGIRMNICAVSTDGHIWHGMRRDDGWYRGFVDLETLAGERGSFVDVDCSNVGDLLHVVGVTSTGGIYHSMRLSTGVWTAFTNVKSVASNPGSVIRLATASMMGELHVVAKVGSGLYHTVRGAGPVSDNVSVHWDPFVNVDAKWGQIISTNYVALD